MMLTFGVSFKHTSLSPMTLWIRALLVEDSPVGTVWSVACYLYLRQQTLKAL